MRAGHRSRTACQLRRLVWRAWRAGAEHSAPSVKSLKKIEMLTSAPGFVSRPDHRVDLLPESRRVKVVFGGETIADSCAARRRERPRPDLLFAGKGCSTRSDASDRTPHALSVQGRSLVLDDRAS